MSFLFDMTQQEREQCDLVLDIAEKQSPSWRMHVGLTLVAGTHLNQCLDEALCRQEEFWRIARIILDALQSHHDGLRQRQVDSN